MFEKISGMAEKMATNVSESRRGFLARAGIAALGLAGVLAGLAVMSGKASGGTYSCDYRCPDGSICVKRAYACARHITCRGMKCKLFRIND
jgi:hypothetical protein